MELIEYLAQARRYSGAKSDRQLAKNLGLSPTVVTNWRQGRAWPSDSTMVKLARLGGGDPAGALLDLKEWSVPEPARSIYKEIAARILPRSAAIGAALFLALTSSPSNAAMNKAETDHQGALHDIHYAIIRYFRRLLKAPASLASCSLF